MRAARVDPLRVEDGTVARSVRRGEVYAIRAQAFGELRECGRENWAAGSREMPAAGEASASALLQRRFILCARNALRQRGPLPPARNPPPGDARAARTRGQRDAVLLQAFVHRRKVSRATSAGRRRGGARRGSTRIAKTYLTVPIRICNWLATWHE